MEPGSPAYHLAGAARLHEGVNVYFPDDSHLNEAGHVVVATALESVLRVQRTPR